VRRLRSYSKADHRQLRAQIKGRARSEHACRPPPTVQVLCWSYFPTFAHAHERCFAAPDDEAPPNLARGEHISAGRTNWTAPSAGEPGSSNIFCRSASDEAGKPAGSRGKSCRIPPSTPSPPPPAQNNVLVTNAGPSPPAAPRPLSRGWRHAAALLIRMEPAVCGEPLGRAPWRPRRSTRRPRRPPPNDPPVEPPGGRGVDAHLPEANPAAAAKAPQRPASPTSVLEKVEGEQQQSGATVCPCTHTSSFYPLSTVKFTARTVSPISQTLI
jgi:hypothetical protein